MTYLYAPSWKLLTNYFLNVQITNVTTDQNLVLCVYIYRLYALVTSVTGIIILLHYELDAFYIDLQDKALYSIMYI